MRHRKDGRRLGRSGSHRQAMLRNLVTSLFLYERVTTTLANAKEARRLADRLISLGKVGSVAARRRAFAVIADRTVVRRLFTEIAPRLNGHRGGYTRVLRVGRRTGDNAELALLELTRLAPVTPKAKGPAPKVKAVTAPPPETTKPRVGKPSVPPEAAPSERPPAPKPSGEQQSPPPKKGFLEGLRKLFKKPPDQQQS